MNQLASKVASRSVGGRDPLPACFYLYVSLRIRQRRIMLGLTQQQMAELIGVTYQQAHKYETGINRISAGRLYQIARALGVDISYFFEDVDPGNGAAARVQELMPQQRMLLELARNFAAIKELQAPGGDLPSGARPERQRSPALSREGGRAARSSSTRAGGRRGSARAGVAMVNARVGRTAVARSTRCPGGRRTRA